MLSCHIIINSCVEFAICEVQNSSPAWPKNKVMEISMSSQVLAKAAGHDGMQKMRKYANQDVWRYLFRYFLMLQQLQIQSVGNSFMCTID